MTAFFIGDIWTWNLLNISRKLQGFFIIKIILLPNNI